MSKSFFRRVDFHIGLENQERQFPITKAVSREVMGAETFVHVVDTGLANLKTAIGWVLQLFVANLPIVVT